MRLAVLAAVAVTFLSCSASTGSGGTGGGAGTAGGVSPGGAGGSGAAGGAGGLPVGGTGGTQVLEGGSGTGGTAGGGECAPTASNVDDDGDGFTEAEGDCADCDPNANPGAYDVPGNGLDEDCNGAPDDTRIGCDGDVADIAYADPLAAARTIGLCHFASPNDRRWGVLDAKYVKVDGSPGMAPRSHGLLPGYGPNVNPQEGQRLLALSTGTARRPGDAGYFPPLGAVMGTQGFAPAGFPIDSPSCQGVVTSTDRVAFDPAALELSIRVPTNARSLRYAFNFYTFEYPQYVCTEYNDFFVALQNPPPPNAQSLNISFDSQGNPVSVNNSLLLACIPGTHNGKTFACPLGTAILQGTGYGGHAATGWLETLSPVQAGGVMQIRFAIWDMGDAALDSTVLIDAFEFRVEPASTAGTRPIEQPH